MSGDEFVRHLENKATQAERYVQEVEGRIAEGDERTPTSKHMNDLHRAEASACRAIASEIAQSKDPAGSIRAVLARGPESNIEAYDNARYKMYWVRTCESLLRKVEMTQRENGE